MCRVGPESRDSIPVQPSPGGSNMVFDLTEWMPPNCMVTESGAANEAGHLRTLQRRSFE